MLYNSGAQHYFHKITNQQPHSQRARRLRLLLPTPLAPKPETRQRWQLELHHQDHRQQHRNQRPQTYSSSPATAGLTEYEINGKEYTVTYDLDNCPRSAHALRNRISSSGNAGEELSLQTDAVVIKVEVDNSVIGRAKYGSKFKLEWYHKNYPAFSGLAELANKSATRGSPANAGTGDLLEHYRYSAFGQVTIYNENGQVQNSSQIDNTILWNTRRRDEVTGYYLYKFRHYSPELGRWPSRDPIEEWGGFNLYGFCVNNPIEYWDYLGLVNKNVDGQQHHWFPQKPKHRNKIKLKCPKFDIDNYVTMMGGYTHAWIEDTKGYGRAWDVFMATVPDCCSILRFGVMMMAATNLEMAFQYGHDKKFWYKFVDNQALIHPYKAGKKDFSTQLASLLLHLSKECSGRNRRRHRMPNCYHDYVSNLQVSQPRMENSTSTSSSGSSSSNNKIDYTEKRLALRIDTRYTDFWKESRKNNPNQSDLREYATDLGRRFPREVLPPNVIPFVPPPERQREAARRQRLAR